MLKKVNKQKYYLNTSQTEGKFLSSIYRTQNKTQLPSVKYPVNSKSVNNSKFEQLESHYPVSQSKKPELGKKSQ